MKYKKALSRRKKTGGVWKKVIETAIVPLVLIGLRNSFTKKKRKYKN
jgi:hypothetical protein